MPPPDFFQRKGEAGGFKVTAFGDPKGVYPTLLAGDDALGRQRQSCNRVSCRTGNRIRTSTPDRLGLAALGGQPPRCDLRRRRAHASASCDPPGAAQPARAWGELIKKMLPPSRLDDLRKSVGKVIEKGGADTKAWLRGCDHAAARLGFLLSDSIDISARVILQGGATGTADGRELMRGLDRVQRLDSVHRAAKVTEARQVGTDSTTWRSTDFQPSQSATRRATRWS